MNLADLERIEQNNATLHDDYHVAACSPGQLRKLIELARRALLHQKLLRFARLYGASGARMRRLLREAKP